MKEGKPNEKIHRIVERLKEHDAVVSEIKVCPLSDYRRYVAGLPRPSERQINDYVAFVSNAHSWYKHLPYLPPGEPFHFFLDPFSGYDCLIRDDGSVVHQERTDTSPRFHYTWMTTKEYRHRFAYLAYEQGAAPDFFVDSQGSTRAYADLPVFTTRDGAYRISPEVAEAGLVELTSLIHSRMDVPEMWSIAQKMERYWDPEFASRRWPSQTGGEETLRRIKELCAREDVMWNIVKHEDLAALVLPERQRLHREMTRAINRMLGLLYD
jgi:hypothetical protein